MKVNDKKNIVVILLLIIIIVMVFTLVFKNIQKQRYEIEQKNFLSNITSLQISLSFYLGKMNNDTFNIYTNEEIILGKNLTEGNLQEKKITPIVDSTKKTEAEGRNAFEVIIENFEKVLGIDIPSYSNMTFYIKDGSVIKVKFEEEPKWWNSALDIYKL